MRSKTKFGLAFQASQPFSHYIECARLAKRYGFDMFQVYDDLLFKPAWPVLHAVAPYLSDQNISLGPGVVNPYHSHPSLIATNLACLHEETRGRAFLMIGKGAFHDLFGVKPVRPLVAIRESIEIISDILDGRGKDHNGIVFGARSGATLRWKLSTTTPPPIWIGTWGPKMCELAGRMTQVSGVMISSITDVSYVRYLKEKVAIGAKSISRDPGEIEIGCVPGTIILEDESRALDLAREASAVYLPYLDPMPEFVGIPREEIAAVSEAVAKGNMKLAASLVGDRAVDSFKLWGNPDTIIEKTSRLIDDGRGVDRMNFGFGRGIEDIQGIELLGSKVLPYFRDQNFK